MIIIMLIPEAVSPSC